MTPREFVDKWRGSTLGERQGAQSHFHDLCLILERDPPADNEAYCFEKGATKTGDGGKGFADVWRTGCFGWEYKGKGADLGAALRQLQAYALDLQNPPYLVVSDMARIQVHTNWTNTVSKIYAFTLDDLLIPETLTVLRQVFDGSENLKPGVSPQELTAQIARAFGDLGRRLQEREDAAGEPLHHPRAIAHFLNRLVFCMFAEDAGLLPENLFTRLLGSMQRRPAAESGPWFDELFAAMRKGGRFGLDDIRYFNGGLFDDAPAIALDRTDQKLVGDLAGRHDWSQIDPAIFGTLFEEALKATRERPALGAHYTDREKILKIVEPVIIRPLEAEWARALDEIKGFVAERDAAEADRKAVFDAAAAAMTADPSKAKAGEAQRRKQIVAAEKRREAAQTAARERLDAHITRLANFRVLDPACGSGNFLYVALHALKDLERRAQVDAEREAGIAQATPRVGLQCVRGIEIEDYAAELARVTLWIGDLQWNIRNSYTGLAEPILSTLDQIENRDALLNADGSEAEWPQTDVIVGNPPFVGAKIMRRELGVAQTFAIRAAYPQLPAFTDLVCYWFEKARSLIQAGTIARAGFLATNSIRKNTNLVVMRKIVQSTTIFNAWSEEKWTSKGASVDVSLACFGTCWAGEISLNGVTTDAINADLTSGLNLTLAENLRENRVIANLGIQKSGPLDIPGSVARSWLQMPANPNGVQNSAVLKPYWNGDDATSRPRDVWLIDLPLELSQYEASLFELPYQHLATTPNEKGVLLPKLRAALSEETAENEDTDEQPLDTGRWWEPWRPRMRLRRRLKKIPRFLATPETALHHLCVWMSLPTLPDKNLIVFVRDDDVFFGLVQSQLHRLWALRKGSDLQDRPRYTHTSVFSTFPFPEGLTPNIPAADYANDLRAQAIAEAAADLNAKREAWLNPADLVRIEPEVVPGFPDRILPKDEAAAAILKKRTLTNLYNERPAWLDMAHKRLDAAVAAAYGWTDWGDAGLPEDEILARLFALNQERAVAGR